jgi:lysophospholipase L1-like esterase
MARRRPQRQGPTGGCVATLPSVRVALPRARDGARWRSRVAAERAPRLIRAAAACAAVVVACLAGVAHGAAPPTAPSPCALSPTTQFFATTRLGVIDLHLFGTHGADVTFFECIGGRAIELGHRTAPGDEVTHMWAATTWRCGRLERRFAATATLADGSIVRGIHAIRTRSCARRFALDVPRRVAPGSLARIRVSDRWRVGDVRTSLCIAGPGRRPSCRQVVFARGTSLALRTVRVAARGRWTVELRAGGAACGARRCGGRQSTRATIAVGVRAVTSKRAAPTLLATGDSTMDPLASFLSDQLGDEANVVSEVSPALAISRSDVAQLQAESNVARLKPSTTVVSIGANEGWDMQAADGATHACCDAAWTDEYVRRVRTTMLTYSRRVFWLTVVAQKDPRRDAIVDVVNAAILRAAEGLPEVHVVRLDLVFSRNGYREAIRYGGRDVRVREPDGVHLNIAGAEIAAREVVKAIHAVSGG